MSTIFRGRARQSLGVLLAAVVLMLVTAGAVRADVTIQKTVKSSGLGGIGASQTEEKLMISGDKKCTKGITKYSGKFSSLMNKGAKEATSITRLDKELIWTLDSEKKTYTELTFQQMRKMMESMNALFANPAKADSLRKAMAKLGSDVEVNKTGEKKTISGLESERVILTIRSEVKDTVGNVTDTTWVKNDIWMVPLSKVPSELHDFDVRMAEKLGVTEGGFTAGLSNQYADATKKLQDKLKDLNGYPLASTFSIIMTTHAEQKTKAEAQTKDTSEQLTEAEEKKQVTEIKDVKSALGGLFKKKAKEEVTKKQEQKEKENQEKSQAEQGSKTVLEVTTEILSITTSVVDPSFFEIPAGYKKVETSGPKK